jgi:hypothetical protein
MGLEFDVEVAIRVEPERIWKALTDTSQVGQWFGWDAETLDEEIQFIFVEHAKPDRENLRIDFEGPGEQHLEVYDSDGNSMVRAVGTIESAAGASNPIEQGWIAFLHQLRRYVESHTNEHRRTLHLTGAGPAKEIAAAVDLRLPGPVWFSGEFTRVYGTGDFGPGAGVLYTSAPLASGEQENATLTLSTWGLSDADFFELTSDWLGWWQGLTEGGEAIVYPPVSLH